MRGATPSGAGRVHQKERTRSAILTAARELLGSGAELTMPMVATRALVSEATAYRYFPDLASLLAEAVEKAWPTPAEALAAVAGSTDPVERVGHAAEVLLRDVQANAASVRTMIAAAVVRPAVAAHIRPGRRFGLIDEALAPLAAALDPVDGETFAQLQRDLAVVMSAEAYFILTDLCGLAPEAAIASTVRTARTVTSAAVAAMPTSRPG